MAFERLADRMAGHGVPNPRRLVIGRGDDALAVGAERRTINSIIMYFEWFADRAGRSAASQFRAVLSLDAVTMRVPSGLKAAEFSGPLPAARAAIERPKAASQMRVVPSKDAVTTRVAPSLNAAAKTCRRGPSNLRFQGQ